MQLWRPEFELDEINSGSWYHCLVTGRLYSSCVRGSTLHGSETWPVRKKMRWHFSRQRRERLDGSVV